MKLCRLFLVFVIVGGLVCVGDAAVSPSEKPVPTVKSEDTLEQLKNRIAKLESRLNESEIEWKKTVSELRSRILYLELQRRLSGNATELQLPPNWVPRTFNGIEYYIVPCDDTRKKMNPD